MKLFTVLSLLLAMVAGQVRGTAAAISRPGTTKLLENDVVAVWDVSWLKQQYPLHTHRYDLVGVSYVEGDRIITQGRRPGRLVNTKAWVFQTNRANVTHVEEGASDPPMRAVLIEVKPPRLAPQPRNRPTACDRSLGAPAWENNRAAAWLIAAGASAATHRHVGDAVELIFDASAPPKATFVPAGTVHAGPTAPEGGRAYIFELK